MTSGAVDKVPAEMRRGVVAAECGVRLTVQGLVGEAGAGAEELEKSVIVTKGKTM